MLLCEKSKLSKYNVELYKRLSMFITPKVSDFFLTYSYWIKLPCILLMLFFCSFSVHSVILYIMNDLMVHCIYIYICLSDTQDSRHVYFLWFLQVCKRLVKVNSRNKIKKQKCNIVGKLFIKTLIIIPKPWLAYLLTIFRTLSTE